jgi:hypothetical protein
VLNPEAPGWDTLSGYGRTNAPAINFDRVNKKGKAGVSKGLTGIMDMNGHGFLIRKQTGRPVVLRDAHRCRRREVKIQFINFFRI